MAIKTRSFRLSDLAVEAGAERIGVDVEIRGATGVEEAGAGDICFLRQGGRPEDLADCAAGAVVVAMDFGAADRPLLRHSNPRWVFALALRRLVAPHIDDIGVHPTAIVADDATIGAECSIGPYAVIESGASIGARTVIGAHCVIGREARIGERCRLDARVVVYRDCAIGHRSRIYSGAVIGADGFGFETHDGQCVRLEHLGRALVGHDVEVGANTTIDRGTTGDTVIEDGAKIDNLVMIAHNCRVGAGAMLAAFTGLAGSSDVGRGAILGGACSIADHARVGDGAMLAGRSGVPNEVPAGGVFGGLPAKPYAQWMRELTAAGKLPQLLKRVRELERRAGTPPAGDA